VKSVVSCTSQNALAASSANGSIHVFGIDKQTLLCDRQLDKEEDCHTVDMSYYDTGN